MQYNFYANGKVISQSTNLSLKTGHIVAIGKKRYKIDKIEGNNVYLKTA